MKFLIPFSLLIIIGGIVFSLFWIKNPDNKKDLFYAYFCFFALTFGLIFCVLFYLLH